MHLEWDSGIVSHMGVSAMTPMAAMLAMPRHQPEGANDDCQEGGEEAVGAARRGRWVGNGLSLWEE